MPEVGWVRLSTRMFENRKIKHLLNQPKGAELTLLWVRLLCLAGVVNDGGNVYVTAKVPYTPQTLSADTGVPVAVVKKAWELFQDLELISISQEGYINITGWEKHQNVDGLNKLRSQTKERVKRYRERNSNVDTAIQERYSNTDVTQDVTLQERYSNTDVTQQNKNKNKNKNNDYHHYSNDDENVTQVKTLRSEIFPLWEKNISPLTALIAEKLEGLIAEVGEAATEYAIVAAVEHGARNFSYIQTVARNYASGNNKTKKQAQSANYSDIAKELYGGGNDAE